MARGLMALDLVLVGAGGALGAMTRHAAGLLLARSTHFPLSTLVVNVAGCMGIGMLMAVVDAREAHAGRVHLLLGVGLLGGLTTFSAFGYDTMRMLRDGAWLLALANIALNVLLGLGAAALGWWIGAGLGGGLSGPR